ncbi:hypothetical protein BDZ97DRAFT_1911773 [Flammula alnicola]|nr:hypothetical protein BDZ97DRAFT_1911773 [Flammula alnicola]
MLESLGLSSIDINVNGASSSDPNVGNSPLVHYCQVAALVIIVYDHLITFDREVEYIWARYFGDILLISDCYIFLNRNANATSIQNSLVNSARLLNHSCAIGLKFVGTGSMIIIIITQMIMQLRIKALYGKTVSMLITVSWVLEVMAVISLGIASLVAIDVHPVILPGASVCNPTYLPRYAFLFWVPVIVFETFLFSLALRIAYQNYLEVGNWGGAWLIQVVLRDNFSFFICAFAAYIVTATTWIAANPQYFTVPGSFSCSLTSIMGCRLILNLCQAYHHPVDPAVTPPLSIWAATTRDIRFMTPPTRASRSVLLTGFETQTRPRAQIQTYTIRDWTITVPPDPDPPTWPISTGDLTMGQDGTVGSGNEISMEETRDPAYYEMHSVHRSAGNLEGHKEDGNVVDAPCSDDLP